MKDKIKDKIFYSTMWVFKKLRICTEIHLTSFSFGSSTSTRAFSRKYHY